jgi:hypothetical protein
MCLKFQLQFKQQNSHCQLFNLTTSKTIQLPNPSHVNLPRFQYQSILSNLTIPKSLQPLKLHHKSFLSPNSDHFQPKLSPNTHHTTFNSPRLPIFSTSGQIHHLPVKQRSLFRICSNRLSTPSKCTFRKMLPKLPLNKWTVAFCYPILSLLMLT